MSSNIRLTPQDILHKNFIEKNFGQTYDEADVDKYLDAIIQDYIAYEHNLDRLRTENARLRNHVNSLRKQAEIPTPVRQNFSRSTQAPADTSTMEILKRLSNLERRVFGTQNRNNIDDSHLLWKKI